MQNAALLTCDYAFNLRPAEYAKQFISLWTDRLVWGF